MSQLKKFFTLESLKDYFIALFLPPWIWIFGSYIILTGLLFFYELSDRKEFVQFSIVNYFSEDIALIQIWYFLSFSLILNYSLNFILKKSYPKLPYFFAAVSVINLIFYGLLLLPHIYILLNR